MIGRICASASIVAAVALAGAAPAQAARHRPRRPVPTISVSGAVTTPATYTRDQLAALPQSTVDNLPGVSLEDLVTAAAPVLPDVKNANLRVVVTVSNKKKSVSFALGELDPSFGNHPALLAQTYDDVALVLPGDADYSRRVGNVRRIVVSVADPTVPTGVAPGSVLVSAVNRHKVVGARTLAGLPQITRTVTFLAGTVSQTHTETGPTLAAVLHAPGCADAGSRVSPEWATTDTSRS